MPYCGAPPAPGTLLIRWNGDPVLLVALLAIAFIQWRLASRDSRNMVASGWAVTTLALVSPLCALSVSLFSARVAQHMIMVLLGAPLIARALPMPNNDRSLWPAAGGFAIVLWFWHLPSPYDATLHSTAIYWAMHTTLFFSAVLLWRELLALRGRPMALLAASTFASMQMALLGAVLTFASHPLFVWHFSTTHAWGMTPLADQQLGGVLMWVPGGLLFLWLGLRTTAHALREPRAAAA